MHHHSFKIQLAMLIAALPVVATAQTHDTQRDHQTDQKARTVEQQKDHASAMKRAQHQVASERLSQQIGRNVYSADNKKIGAIEDLVLDAGNDRISYAVVSFGGFMGMGEKYFAIPWSSIEQRANTGGDNEGVSVNISPEQLKNAPGFDKNNWPDTASNDFRQSVDTYYGVNQETRSDWYARNNVQRLDKNGTKYNDANRKDRMLDKKDNTPANTTHSDDVNKPNHAHTNATKDAKDGNKPSQAGPMEDGLVWSRRVSAILGTNVRNSQNENVGEIKDLIMNPRTGDVEYAILTFGGMMGIGNKLFTVPMDRLQVSTMDQQLVLDVPKQTLKNAKGFEDENWPDWNDADYRNSVDNVFKDLPTRQRHRMNDTDRDRSNMSRKTTGATSESNAKVPNEKNGSDNNVNNNDNQDDM